MSAPAPVLPPPEDPDTAETDIEAALADLPQHDPLRVQLLALRSVSRSIRLSAARIGFQFSPAAEAQMVQGVLDRGAAALRGLTKAMAREALWRLVLFWVLAVVLLAVVAGAAGVWFGYELGSRSCARGTVQIETASKRPYCVFPLNVKP